MRSLLTVTTPAADLQLLTIAEMREAAGVDDNSQDAELTALGLKVAADICTECDVRAGQGAAPTLRQETLTEVFRAVSANVLVLSRRHEAEIASIVEDGEALDEADYEVDPESGLVWRLCEDLPARWCADKITVVYDAGFETVPDDLKDAATDFFRSAWQGRQRDPLVKGERVEIPDVEQREVSYWVGAVPGRSNEGAVPDAVEGKLTRFRNVNFA